MEKTNIKKANQIRFVLLMATCISVILSMPIFLVENLIVKYVMFFLIGLLFGIIILGITHLLDIEEKRVVYIKK